MTRKALSALTFAKPGGHLDLSELDPAARPLSSGNDGADKAAVADLAEQIAGLQALLWAGKRHRVLVVLQGVDASGKDGATRHVFGRCSPLGLRAVSWRPPSEQDLAHDPLWRIHPEVPGDGELVVFNRSHYEEAIEPAVWHGLRGEALRRRCVQFNDFERMLVETGTLLIKFFLHVSRAEQARRLRARRKEPSKLWKADPADLEAAKRWRSYRLRYGEILGATATAWAPWTVVPADDKTHRDLLIGKVVLERLRSLKLRAPTRPTAPGRTAARPAPSAPRTETSK